MKDILNFPGEWHGDPLEQEQPPTEENIDYNHLDHLQDILGKLLRFREIEPEIYAMHREHLNELADNQIIGLINQSSERNWAQKITYYKALLDEANDRKLISDIKPQSGVRHL